MGRVRRILPLFVLLALVAPVRTAAAGGRLLEKNANLDIARRVASRLAAAHVPVVMTRTSDRTVSLGYRTWLANTRRVDAFVSIHNNASTSPRPDWSEVYHQIRGGGSATLGRAIARSLEARLDTPARLLARRGDHGDYYFVLRNARMPAVIVEGAFVSNPRRARLLATSPAFRQAIADAIVDGILAFQRTLVAVPLPVMRPGIRTTVPALPAPADGHGTAINARTVGLSWRPTGLPIGGVRIYRDGALIGEVAPDAQGFDDVYAAPGQTYRYEIRTAVGAPERGAAESTPLRLTVRTPPIVVALDPGHGGSDPGAVGRW